MSYTDKGRIIVHPVKTALLRPWHWGFKAIDEHTRHWIQPPRFRRNPQRQSAVGVEEKENQRQLHRLCNVCQNAFGKSKLLRGSWLIWIRDSEVHKLHSSMHELNKGVESLCHFCTLLHEYITTNEDAPTAFGSDHSLWLEITTAFGNFGKHYRVDVHLGAKPSIDNVYRLRQASPAFDIFLGNPAAAPSMRFSSEKRCASSLSWTNTGSNELLLLVRYWLQMCLRYHPKCGKPTANFTPSRLLDVGSTDEPNICILICGNSQQRHTYLTLSHSWGGLQGIIKLTSANMDMLKENIRPESLPKSFQDAVRIARFLGVRYLWIDSLCIIQDSKEDWVAEAALMGSIYENSLCTIAASAAIDSNHGCFTNRDPIRFATCHVAGSAPYQKGLFIQPPISRRTFSHCHLDTRAWTFQEKILSPRTISFGRLEIQWSCGLGIANEQDMYGQGSCYLGDEDMPNSGPLFGNDGWNAIWAADIVRDYHFAAELLHKEDGGDDLDFHRWWYRLVKEYSERDLTMSTDKLVALSGIAEKTQMRTGRSYVAGIWKETIHHDLLWRVGGRLTPRPSGYRAPSWSWAAVDGLISTVRIDVGSFSLGNYSFDITDRKNERVSFLSEIKSVQARAQAADRNSTGQILHGQLTIVGRLKDCNVSCLGPGAEGFNHRNKYRRFDDGRKLRFFPDCDEHVAGCFLLPLKQTLVPENKGGLFDPSFDLSIEGLVLVCAQEKFRRVGLFGLYSEEIGNHVLQWFDDCPVRTINII